MQSGKNLQTAHENKSVTTCFSLCQAFVVVAVSGVLCMHIMLQGPHKRKGMILGPLCRVNLPLLTTTTDLIDRVISSKLLGIHINLTMSWSVGMHVDSMVKKAAHRSYFLKQLKRAGLTSTQR